MEYSKEEIAYREELIAKIEEAFNAEVSEIQTPILRVVK